MKRYRSFLGIEFRDLDKCNVKEKAIRINNLKIQNDILFDKLKKKGVLLKKVPYLKYGYTVENTKLNLASTPEYLLGEFYIQSSSSQIPVEVLDPQKNEKILDMCAAPGSKFTQICAYSLNKAIVVGVERDKKRIKSLHNNIERMGCQNFILYNDDVLDFESDIKFDKILLDAPCSGNFCLEKQWFEKRGLEDIKKKAKYQKMLLEKAVTLLKNKGTIVYSTCSLEPEENEKVVEFGMNELNLKLEKIDLNIQKTTPIDIENKEILEKCVRIWPHIHNTDGFFIAKFRN